MKIAIKEVNQDNMDDIISLRVDESQKTYIETPLQCLQEAEECTFFRPVGLYIDELLVGFAMYGYFPQEKPNGRVWLDRYLIDMKYQGQGWGKILLQSLIDHLVRLYDCEQIYLSLYDDNEIALKLYQKFGFRFNGELDVNGERVMVKQLN
ncbi:diamine N-acetyltransferase [Paenibacillus shirakamiensis]|uniref:Diamine N-acetyltransferase n=1 Tax=Paenibacillus shirakamiensis TaxID=1265935 RepID=A0ABS4JKN3_9BACL|nr:GNAT family N-acetyltransferase [Paenibacillus shirakamiensis]MBP2002275.1 diamine N-acetyltransferase [Paenibacillus shirakamiensis]